MSKDTLTTRSEAQATAPPFRKRCQQLGFCVVFTNDEGEVFGFDCPGTDPIYELLIRADLFRSALITMMKKWHEQAMPKRCELWSGMTVMAFPAVRVREHALSMNVVVLPDQTILQSREFADIAADAEVTEVLAVHGIGASLPPRNMIDQIAEMIHCMHNDLRTVWQQGDEIETLHDEITHSSDELSLVYKLSRGMCVSRDPMQFMHDALQELRRVVKLRWIALRLSDTEHRLHDLRGKLVIAGDGICSREFADAIGTSLIVRSSEERPTVVDMSSCPTLEGTEDVNRQLLVVPIVRDGKRLAVLFGADKTDGTELTRIDSRLLSSATQNLSIFLENTMLYDDMEDMFIGTLHALVSSIDAKDSYTFGHSERVAWLSKQLAMAAGLNEDTVQRVHLSALVHDIGKIGVPEYVLTKSGKLTEEEFDMVKAHPELGVKIIEQIPQMVDLIPGVLYHHERWDGRGYPHGLSGYDIPLFGRIICLADSFDAMSSSRTYREAMSVEAVYVELDRCAGTQFDPDLARVFLDRVDLARYYAMLADHQYHQSPLHRVLRKSA